VPYLLPRERQNRYRNGHPQDHHEDPISALERRWWVHDEDRDPDDEEKPEQGQPTDEQGAEDCLEPMRCEGPSPISKTLNHGFGDAVDEENVEPGEYEGESKEGELADEESQVRNPRSGLSRLGAHTVTGPIVAGSA